MKIIFLNPQGNFDARDSHLTEHPDFGGQLVYVKEVSKALVEQFPEVEVDIVTRRIDDSKWSAEFAKEISFYPDVSDRLRIVRIPCGGNNFLRKELLWKHIPEWVDNIISFYGSQLPDYATAHYGDGGYAAVLLQKKTGIPFSFTAHSLGAQKLDKLFREHHDFEELDAWYQFSKRIQAERLSVLHASLIITSTAMEHTDQYTHPLYREFIQSTKTEKFAVIPPGVNTSIFNTHIDEQDRQIFDKIDKKIGKTTKPAVILSSRLDEKKNHLAAVKAYANDPHLPKKARLGIFLRGIDDPYREADTLGENERKILKAILQEVEDHKLQDKVFFLNLLSQKDLAAAYKYFARLKSLFVLTAFYEPFGLAPIEAGACGLVPVTTQNGGPSDIFKDDKGILIDPANTLDIAAGMNKALEQFDDYSQKVKNLVLNNYTWQQTAKNYYRKLTAIARTNVDTSFQIPVLNASEDIKTYLKKDE
jgi:sucrose-phosphate synthase